MKHKKEFKKYCDVECMIRQSICGGKKEEKNCYVAFIDLKYEQIKNKIKTLAEGIRTIEKLLPSARQDDNDIKWVLNKMKETIRGVK